MLESVVSTLLNRVLGAYVSNLNYSQLKVGIWSGEVTLRDLKLKREALDKFNLPVDVLEGYLGELTLTIPWNNLRGKPVVVHIKDVYVLAVPRNESSMTAEEIAQREHEGKMRKLENAELVSDHHDAAEDAKNDTFANQLLTKILNNLQFSITNIHVRYEDNISTDHRFAAGITLSELSAITTDENWIANTISETVNTIHKLATLESLSVYWDTNAPTLADHQDHTSFKDLIATKHHVPVEHQYILKPVSGTGRVKLHKNFGGLTPKIDASLLFDELSFTVDNEQYRDTVLMIDLFHSYLKKQKYKHLHPPVEVTPKTHPLDYFRFAGQAVLSEIHERNERWTWKRIKKRSEDRKNYVQCYVQHKLDRATPEQLETLEHLERELSYEDLRFYRSLAKPKLRTEKARLAAIEKKRKEEAAANKSKQGWGISSWWYGAQSTANTSQDGSEEDDLVITEEQKLEFYDVIDYDADKAAIAASVDLPKDTMLLSLNTSLNKGSFTVRKNPHDDPLDLISLVFDNVSLGMIQYTESFTASAALGDLCLYDGLHVDSPYHKLMGAKEKKDENTDEKKRRKSSAATHLIQQNDPFFTIEFEHKPLDQRADNAAALFMRNIDIVYNPIVIHEIIQFFTPPETSADSINALIEVAGDTLEDIKNQTRVSLEFALDQHTTFDLHIDMDAPVIIVPEDCSSIHSRGIVIDAGHIHVESQLAPPEALALIKSKSASDMTVEDNIQLRKLMYDKFTVKLTQTKILVGDSIETCLVQVRTPREEFNYLHLVDRIDMTFLAELCIIRKSVEMPRIKVSGHLPLLKVNFSDTKYRAIMQLPRLIEASGLLGSNREEIMLDEAYVQMTKNNQVDQKWFNLMNTPLRNKTQDDIFFNDETDTSSSAGETETTEATEVTHSVKKRDKDAINMEERVFQLDFKVDRVLANVLEARQSNVSEETLLCQVDLQNLILGYSMRPMDMTVSLSLESLDVKDCMQHGNAFKYLVTSDQQVVLGQTGREGTKNLVNVEYVRCDQSSPEYFTKYKGIHQTVQVTLSTLNFIVTQSSVLTLHHFIQHTFVDDEAARPIKPTRPSEHIQRQSSTHVPKAQLNPSQKKEDSNIYVRLLLDSVNFVLNNDGTRLATGELSLGDMSTLLTEGQVNVAAKFANFTLTDNSNNQLLTIQGEELFDLRYNSFVNDGREGYPGYDHALYVRMGSAQFNFLEQPVHQFLDYLSKFAELKTAYDRARQAALESAQQLSEAATKMHFDLVVKTPVVFFPELHQHPSDVVVAHLGEIWASNSFVDESDGCINTIKAGLRAMNLTSKFYFDKQLQTLPMVDDIDLTFDVKIPQETSKSRSDIDILGNISNVTMRLTERQYVFLMEAINMFSRVFTSSNEPVVEDDSRKSSITTVSSQEKKKAIVSEEEKNNALPRIQMAMAVKTIGLEIYMDHNKEPKLIQEPTSLARIALNNTDMKLHMFKDDSIDVNLVVHSLTVDDTRSGIKSQFKHIVPVIEDGHQFELQLDLKAPDPVRSGIVVMTVKDPKIILSLDHAFLLRDFFLLPFNDKVSELSGEQQRRDSGTQPEQHQQHQHQQQQQQQGLDLSYLLNIVNAEFILLANPDQANSEAVVLSTKELMITQQTKTALVVKQMGMFLCRMDMRKKSTLRFIQPFDVNLSMNSNPKNEQGGLLTDLVMNIDPLVLRLSYRDAMLVTDIFNKAYELYNASMQQQGNKSSMAMSSAQGLLTPAKELDLNDLVLAQESLRISFQGAQIILIEELHETPMIDMNLKPFNVEVANWSKNLSATVEFSTYINYFNIKNSHWEPLLEPWNFRLELARNLTNKNEPLTVKLISNSILNMNVTHTFLESAMATVHLLDKQKNTIYSGERGTVAPYELRNRTGYNIMVWNTTDSKEGPVIKEIKNGDNLPWWFEDWKKRRETTSYQSNNLNVQIDGQVDGAMWESLRNIKLDTEGEHMHPLRPMIKNVLHRIVFDVKLVDNIKIVTIRSALVIENKTLLSIDLASVDPQGKMDGPIQKIAPGEDYPIPIEKAYTNRFCVRPDAGFGYQWAQSAFHWKDFATPNKKPPTTISCLSGDSNGNMPPFVFQMHARLDKKSILFGQYPAMAIRLSAPIEIENLLPFDFNFRVVDKTSGQDFSSYLRKGGITPIHVIENGHLVLLNIEMPDTDYNRSEYAIISTKRTDDLDIDRNFELINKKDKTKLHIGIDILDIPDSGGAKKYSIFSPYIIINKTGLPISFKEKPAWSDALYSSGETVTMCRPGPKPEPFMYSYPHADNRNRTLIQVDKSDWSQPLSFEAIGSVYDVALPNQGRSEEIHVGITVQEGQGKLKLTKTITITPRFVLSNQLEENIRYRIPETKNDYILEAKERIPLYNIRVQNEKQLTIKLEGYSNSWSAPFNIQDIGDIHIRLANDYGKQDTLIRVSTVIQDATIFIVLTKEADDNWPYLLVNKTDEDMTFHQEDPVVLRDDYSSVPVRNPRIKRYRLPAHQHVPYSWDLPAYKDKKIILTINGRERSINLQEIGTMLPFRHTTREGKPVITSIDVKIRGSHRVLELKPFSQSESLFKPVSGPLARVDSSASLSSVDSASKEGFEAADMDMTVNAVFQIQIKEMGVSLIDRRLQEVAYATFKGIDLKLTDSTMYHSLRWNIDWVQIDNQMYGSIFPILLYPTNLTDNGDRNRKDKKILPTVQMALDRVKDDSHGVVYFKYFSILMQEMSIEVDESFIYAIMEFAHLNSDAPAEESSHDARVWEYTTDIPDVKAQDNIAQIYFEVFSIQPIRFNLSFLRSDQDDNSIRPQQSNNPLMYIVNAMTMAIGNINQAPLKFNALAIENIMASGPDLANRITIHYSDQFIYQVHRILGSADFLGNPVGLFNNLSSGVAELFYEPWQGLIMSDRPQDLGIGIAKGFSGFVKKSVFGVSDSFTKFTGSIGKGLSAATMDREYQDRRRMNMARNRPKHALVGVAQGATSFANSVASGFSGLVTRPMEGATKDGVGGFIKGFGKGLVGVVTKPAVGVFDFTSNVTEGIRNTATPADTNMIERVRYPRYIGPDGLLKPYSLREAIGQHWLKDVDGGKYINDAYIAHCHVQNDERVAMLTSNRLMLIRTRKLTVEWQEPFTEIQTIKREPTGIAIYLRNMSWEPFLIISDKHSREEFFRKIEDAVIKYNMTRRSDQ